MTTIRLAKSINATEYYLEIYGATIEEDLSATYVDFPYPFPEPDWGTPTVNRPRREVLDFLDRRRVFTITGTIDKDSNKDISWSTSGITAQVGRDTLVKMAGHGGTIRFYYGIPADGTDYVGTTNLMYYTDASDPTKQGFECYIESYKITEEPEDTDKASTSGSYYLPSKYHVIITLFYGKKLGSI